MEPYKNVLEMLRRRATPVCGERDSERRHVSWSGAPGAGEDTPAGETGCSLRCAATIWDIGGNNGVHHWQGQMGAWKVTWSGGRR